MATSMQDILSDSPPEKVVETPKEQLEIPVGEAPTVEAKEVPVERARSRRKQWEDKEQAAQGRVRDPETGQFLPIEAAKEPAKEAPKAEVPAPEKAKVELSQKEIPEKPTTAAPQQDLTDKEKAFLRGLQEERSKRQEMEKKLAALETSAKAAGSPGEPAKTFWDDPEAALKKQQEEIRNVATNVRLQTAELISRQKHSDFDEKIEEFGKILQQTPGLHQQWLGSPDPAEFAYNIGKNHLELQQAGSLDKLREKIEQDVRAKLEAELRDKADKLAREKAALPPSLTEARSTGSSRPVWSGPTSIDDILTGK